jgi:hypothetical protein
MGFKLSKIFKSVTKAFDPLLPESAKKLGNKVGGIVGVQPFATQDNSSASPAPAPAPAALDISSLTDEQMTAEAQKRMAKLGKYFTSPLGVLSSASTGSQRTFS